MKRFKLRCVWFCILFFVGICMANAQKLSYEDNSSIGKKASSSAIKTDQEKDVGSAELAVLLNPEVQLAIAWSWGWFYPPTSNINGVSYYGGVGQVHDFHIGYDGDGSTPPTEFVTYVLCNGTYYGFDDFNLIDTSFAPFTNTFLPMGFNEVVGTATFVNAPCSNGTTLSVSNNPPQPGDELAGYNYQFDNCEVYNDVPFVNLIPSNNYTWIVNGQVQTFPFTWVGNDLVFNSVVFNKSIPSGQPYIEENWQLLENGNQIRNGRFRFFPGEEVEALCQDVSVILDTNGNASITTADVDNGSTGCGTVSLSLSQTTFDCDDVPSVQVTLTATDSQGNTDNCTATVTVVDDSPPVFTFCLEDFTISTDPGLCTGNSTNWYVTATDNCSVNDPYEEEYGGHKIAVSMGK